MTKEELCALERVLERNVIEKGPMADKFFGLGWIEANGSGGCVVTLSGWIVMLRHQLEVEKARVSELEKAREKVLARVEGLKAVKNDLGLPGGTTAAEAWDFIIGMKSSVAKLETENYELRARVAELQEERAKIVDAVGMAHDDDPDAPKTLVEYVRETQLLAVRCASEWASDHAEASVRKLSRGNITMLDEVHRLRRRVEELQVEASNQKGGDQ